MTEKRPDPRRTNPEAAPYFDGLDRGEVMYQRCRRCDAAIFYPRTFCPYCLADDPQWHRSSGRGRVYTFSEVHTPPYPDDERPSPYTIGIVEMAEGFHLFGEFVPTDSVLAVDTPVVATVLTRHGRSLLCFEVV